jgi:glycine/D-amino acid oxidase-like deaminating enzyme
LPSREIHPNWGQPPWHIGFTPKPAEDLPAVADLAVVGAGFTGLAAAAWHRRLAPDQSVVVLEAGAIGAGASGRTGGMALAETAAGDLPGLGDVLAGFQQILRIFLIDCDLDLRGAWEIARTKVSPGEKKDSPIAWPDSGTLRVVKEVPGGTLDPGKLVAGLARAAESNGAIILEDHPLDGVEWTNPLTLEAGPRKIRARKILFATSALSLGLSGLDGGLDSRMSYGMHPRLTLAGLTRPVSEDVLRAIGLGERKPFYTVDFPYLWGRVRADNSIVWGAGLVSSPDEQHLEDIDISAAEPARMFAALERRVRGLHPALSAVEFTHRWGGPILFRDSWTPVFDWHTSSRNAVVLGAFAGHGVALSSYLAAWAAAALLGRRDLPSWGKFNSSQAIHES